MKAAYDGLSSTITANKVVAGKNITVTELPNGAGTEVALSDNLSFGDKDGNNVAIKGNEGIIALEMVVLIKWSSMGLSPR